MNRRSPEPRCPQRPHSGSVWRWLLGAAVVGILLHGIPRAARLATGEETLAPARTALPRRAGPAAFGRPSSPHGIWQWPLSRLLLESAAWGPSPRQMARALGPPAARRLRVARPPRRLFSFAAISDLHEGLRCDVSLGPALQPAIRLINRLRPDFVVGVGDLVAGGGDCKRWGAPAEHLGAQLAALDRHLLRRLRVPFVPVSGNHDLSDFGSLDPEVPWHTWRRFWQRHRHAVLAQARPGLGRRSHRFRYGGVGFVLVGDYGTDGLSRKELSWLRRHLRPRDIVFRHAAPWGVSCLHEQWCGIAIRTDGDHPPSRLVHLLETRRVAALFSGHTHAFYHGVCGAVPFVNTGSLGTRSMEYVRGWEDSPYARRQAFVWVDVYRDRSLEVAFFVWNPQHERFEVFDSDPFPPVVQTEVEARRHHSEGVSGYCFTPSGASRAAARLRRRIGGRAP